MPVLPNSRNLLTDVIQPIDPVSGEPSSPAFIDLRQRVTTFAPDDQFYTVQNADTWGYIGLQLLGDARNWWAVADLSGIVDPFAELVVGAQLRSPSITRFTFVIMAPQNTS
jgi:hypothetical protein